MEFDFSKLRGLIKEKYGSDRSFAKAMNMSTPVLSSRLCGMTPWRLAEIYLACKLLSIPETEVAVYFFTQKFDKIEQE